jgi:hypothetical protein
VNRSAVTQAVVWLDAIAAKAKAERDRLREQLDADAYAEFREQGTAPTWRIPDVATVSASVSKQSVSVADEVAFAEWVTERYPDAVETVTRVRDSWRQAFLDRHVEVAGEDMADTATGEVVPGVKVRPGGRFLGVSIRASAEAKQVFGLAAGEGLKHAAALAGPNVPVVLAELEAGPEEANHAGA